MADLQHSRSEPWTEESVAAELLACEAERRSRSSFNAEWPALDLAMGYRIQNANLATRLARGETVVGVKLGLTSRAKQRRMGIDNPSVAWLTDAMILPAGEPIPQSKLIHPRVEPEIAFVMKDRLEGPGVTAAQAYAAVGSVLGAAEVIDSRYQGFKFSIGDAVADNGSSGFFVTGPVSLSPDQLDLALEGVLVEVDGEIVDSATGADVMGHPAEALAFAANDLATRGQAIEAGWLVLTGGITDAYYATPGTSLAAHFTHLGSVHLFAGAAADPADAG